MNLTNQEIQKISTKNTFTFDLFNLHEEVEKYRKDRVALITNRKRNDLHTRIGDYGASLGLTKGGEIFSQII
ncbi:MAG: hypothetical protein IH946_04380 [Bacteroidetes bacterium]|nr:hypothetical protein [Bacteroidota bacterium]